MGEREFVARWTDGTGTKHEATFATYARAVSEVARCQSGGLRFHDLRHS